MARSAPLLLLGVVCGAALLTATAVSAAPPFWEPAGLQGQAVSSVTVGTDGSVLAATTAGPEYTSRSSAWQREVPSTFVPEEPAPGWTLGSGGKPHYLGREIAQAPSLNSGTVLAAPVSLPGEVMALDPQGHLWAGSSGGAWSQPLLLLPDTLWTGTPRITGVTAFTRGSDAPQAVYVSTAGFGVLISEDAGVDWLRADTGLPRDVSGIAADPTDASVWAATSDGIWVHRVAPLPAPPLYTDSAYWARVAGIIAVVVAGLGVAFAALRRTGASR